MNYNFFFKIELKSYDKLIRFQCTEQNLDKVSMALERGLVETFQFNSLFGYENFGDKFLLEAVFVKIDHCETNANFSIIDFQFVNQMNILIVRGNGASLCLQNESFLSTNWQKLSFLFSVEPSAYEDCARLISRLNVKELEFYGGYDRMDWSELLKYSTLESREKIRYKHLFRRCLPEDPPQVGLLKIFVPKAFSNFFNTFQSNALLEYIGKRPYLKELEFRFHVSSDFDTCKSVMDEYDWSSLNREFSIILTSKSGQRAVFHISPIQ